MAESSSVEKIAEVVIAIQNIIFIQIATTLENCDFCHDFSLAIVPSGLVVIVKKGNKFSKCYCVHYKSVHKISIFIDLLGVLYASLFL